MAITVARIPYLSCEPFYFDMEQRGIELRELAPSKVVAAIGTGEIDAGLAPLSECFHLGEGLDTVSGFCLAMAGRAGSVFLHSRQPIQEMTGARVGVVGDASASLKLLQVLLSMKYQVQPEAYVALEESYDAVLLIGNEALRTRGGVRGYPHKYDLGEEWHEWTGLPLVLARWVARSDLDRLDRVLLEDTMFVGVQDWADGNYRVSEARNRVRMHPQDIIAYTQGIRYFIGAPEQRAIDRFRECLEQLP